LDRYVESYDGVIVSEHKADENYSIVGSASIIAKTVRDEEIDKLKDIYGDIGSGYPSDRRTMLFLEKYGSEDLNIIRKSWKPYKAINGKNLKRG
jgi:ribonuclease HII